MRWWVPVRGSTRSLRVCITPQAQQYTLSLLRSKWSEQEATPITSTLHFAVVRPQENAIGVNRSAVFASRASEQAAYFSSGTFEAADEANLTNTFPSAGKYMFMQLQEQLPRGWAFWKSVTRYFQKPADTRQPLGTHLREWSRLAGYNLVPFFAQWKFPVTANDAALVDTLNLTALPFDATAPCGIECTQCCMARDNSSLGSNSTSGGNTSIAHPTANYTIILGAHNVYRSRHSAPPMTYEASLAADADAYALKCIWQHDPANLVDGENLYALAGEGVTADAALNRATDAW